MPSETVNLSLVSSTLELPENEITSALEQFDLIKVESLDLDKYLILISSTASLYTQGTQNYIFKIVSSERKLLHLVTPVTREMIDEKIPRAAVVAALAYGVHEKYSDFKDTAKDLAANLLSDSTH